MAVFCVSPQLGPPLTGVIDTNGAWFGLPPMSGSNATVPVSSPKVLSKALGSDGIEYIFVKAGGSIAASTQCAIDATTGVATTGGSSGFYTQASPSAGVTSGQYFWAKKAAV